MQYSAWLKKTGASGILSLFVLTAAANALDIIDDIQTYSSLTDTVVNMSGQSELHITSGTNPIPGCTINLNSLDSWFFLENIEPSVVNSTYLSQVRVSGAAAVLNSNVRLAQYLAGTIVIPHPSGYQPLTIYSGFNYTGSWQSLGLYTYYTGTGLGVLNYNISSFTLKRGYMATFAQSASGTGISRAYVAQDRDLHIPAMPEELNDSVSFVRVFPWRWTGKKGMEAGGSDADWLDCDWSYDYNNVDVSTLNREYVPHRHNPNWNAYSNINNKQNSTHAMGYNEPDNPGDDGYSTVADAIAAWPNLMASGLRLVSPGPRDSGTGWLYDFIDQADALNYRVDAVAIHYYRDNESVSTIRNWLAGIHNRTGRPIWVTEWNDGCNWTGGDPTDPYLHADRIIEMAQAMDDMPFVERYAVYSACAYRELISGGSLTPAGLAYQAHAAPAAYAQEPGKGGFGCAYYPFDNNALDSLFFENHSSVQGGAGYTAGHSGQAIDLDGVNDYVILPENLADCEDFTFAAWVWWDGGNQWQRIFDFGHGNTHYMMLAPRSGSNTLRFDITTTGNTSPQRMETSQLASSQWVHVAVTISGNTGKLFVNGSQVTTNTSMIINPSDLGASSNYLGRSHWAADPFFNGRLDDVHIADYALTNTQITALYNGTAGSYAPVFPSDPVIKPDILHGNAYGDTLFYNASDFDADAMLTFSKTSGPSWLTAAADGTLSGTPLLSDVGLNSFVVRATDSLGAYDEAALQISVVGFGLQSHYEFENNVNDSVGSKDGTATGSPAYTAGYIGQAIDLDGTDDYVTLPANLIYTDDITIAAWINWDGGDIWQRIFDFGTGTAQYMFLTPSSYSNTLRFAITTAGNGNEQRVETSSALATGQWVHVAVTLNGNVGTLYVNGSPEATNPSMTINPIDFNPLFNYIGKSQWSDPLFNGRIDDFRIYNYALSDTEIASLASPSFTADPILNLDGIELRPYAGLSLTNFTDTPDNLFAKDAGPSWLSVAPNGTLSGIPTDAHAGENIFTVRIENLAGLFDTAQMTIQVANVYSGVRGIEDLAGLAAWWLVLDCTDTPACGGADLGWDTNADVSDLAVLANNWLASEDLHLYFPLEEMSGDVTDDYSIYSRSGSLVNDPAWSAGISGGALDFDGVDDYVVISGYKGITVASNRTCCAWIQTTQNTIADFISWGSLDTGAKWSVGIKSNVLSVRVQGGNIFGSTLLNDGLWHHVAVTWEPAGNTLISNAKLYVDGVEETISALLDIEINTAASEDVHIGNFQGLNYYQGLIDEVRIYDRALTQEEIQELATP